MRFTELTPTQRVAALLEPGSLEAVGSAGALVGGIGQLGARRVCVAATDPAVARGAIGMAEARGLSQLLARGRAGSLPVVLLLDSSGARVDEGLPALGAFRRLLRETLLTRVPGTAMLAVVGSACFGGGSLLACACTTRHYLAGARLAASGPAVIEATQGAARFDARDSHAVDTLMGSAARVRVDRQARLVEDRVDDVRQAVAAWMGQQLERAVGWRPELDHALLGTRLQHAGALAAPTSTVSPALRDRLAALLPRDYRPKVQGEVFCALPAPHSGKTAFLGTLSGVPVGAATCWQLADWLLAMHRTHPASPIVLVLDAEGHAATIVDEQLLLSAYLVHLSLTLAWLSGCGHRIVLWIPGKASGASYAVFAAPVERVSVLPSARVAVLPPAAIATILRAPQDETTDASAMLEAGVADALLDTRLQRPGSANQ